jgi:hypothetical protein
MPQQQQTDEFAKYARTSGTTAKDEFAQFTRSPEAKVEQKMAPGTFQTMKGGPLYTPDSKAITYPTTSSAVSGAKARTSQPEFPKQLTESKTTAKEMLPEIGSTIGMVGGLPGSAVGAGIGKAMQPVMDGGKPDVLGGAATGLVTYAGGKALETAMGAIPLGKYILNKVVAAKDAKQIGDAMETFMEAKPAGMTRQMLMRDLNAAHKAASEAYGDALRSVQVPVNIDNLMSPIRAEALAREAKVPGVASRVEKLLEAAKMKAGITGPTASVGELAQLKNVLRKVAYRATDDPIALATNDVIKMADHTAGAHIRGLSPEAGEALDAMTNIHAARSGLKNYKPGKVASIAISAALHPTAARIIAPAAATALGVGGEKLLRRGSQAVSMLP